MNRTGEFVLGLIGGILGLFAGVFALLFGAIDAGFSETGTSSVTGLGFGALLFSVLGIVGSVLVRNKAKLGGILMIVAAVGGFISVSAFFIISGILLLIAGIMGVARKDKTATA
ncbi:DUF4064 domain-containing protein [Marinococcus sp. PL1-022]|uniref:DUF4064 domain-containing protein n=1 Tax=Marinococcus sp. PL1-022 TaxID=3095363 RepID=UPI0029C4F4DA|nr:DUF4064 domain-containing protein [Marinococcus sp. PL1-022]MDX6152817.1 DUF4064 domain-containing protein [Marinococcus sp. PL1-022]